MQKKLTSVRADGRNDRSNGLEASEEAETNGMQHASTDAHVDDSEDDEESEKGNLLTG
jgi:hypothetical protein